MRVETGAVVAGVLILCSAKPPRARPLGAKPALSGGPWPGRRLPGEDRRARRRRLERLPHVLELLVRELRAGATLATAVAHVAPSDQTGLATAVVRIDQGEPVMQAMDRWLDGFPPADAAFVGGVFRLGLHTGTAMADSLDRAAEALRGRRELADEVRALTAQSQASALIVGLAPLGFLAFMGATDVGAVAFLFTEPAGWACGLIGLSLEAVGFWWMRRLVQRFDR